ATLVAIAALAAGRKVVLSRGEMVEIGGSYRVPEIIAQSGAVLHEVGTTNRTHLKDYRSAVDDGTGALLKVHTSNYQVLGFTSAVPIDQLVELGRERGVPVIHDLGSGCVVELERFDLPPDQLAQRCLAAGADLVCFSGDKLLGGPQCGILAGTKAAVERCREHPLFRAMRPGRLIYAALEATLRIYLDGPEEAARRVPTLACLTLGVDELESRARRLLADLEPAAGVEITMVACASQAGSGSLPLAEIPSRGLRVTVDGVAASELARRLRLGEPAVLGLVRDDALLLDLRAVARSELGPLAARLRELADG
ncbi:MAG: L-seryl-tRNA(Sec) selenium transferase, partial [Acidobacteriota bacterium]|nr:L-seryl-tRNA(Sec) selenium transferase [Acidobacteriota bacterium]